MNIFLFILTINGGDFYGVNTLGSTSNERLADRIRINAQLIDALTGRHIWPECYDRDLKDLFALQDEITMKHDNVCIVKS